MRPFSQPEKLMASSLDRFSGSISVLRQLERTCSHQMPLIGLCIRAQKIAASRCEREPAGDDRNAKIASETQNLREETEPAGVHDDWTELRD